MYDNDQNYGWKSYDNQSYDNRQYGGDPDGRRPQPEDMPPKKKKGGILKKAALITAGALLFGTVSGATMVGVNVAVSRFMGNSAAASAEAEKKEEISKAQTESQGSGQDNGQGSAQGNGGYQQGQRNNGKAVAILWNRLCPQWWQSPVRRYTRVIITDTAGFSGGDPRPMRYPAAVRESLWVRMTRNFSS